MYSTSDSNRAFGKRSKNRGKATSAIIAFDFQAPAQKCGPAPNEIAGPTSRVMSF
jgi:hypothetical protein